MSFLRTASPLGRCRRGENKKFDPEWRHKMVVPGILIADERSLCDNLNMTGKIPKERQTMIELFERTLNFHRTDAAT